MLTEEPLAATTCTTPSTGAIISFSIFIASRMNRTSPVLTVCPLLTLISNMVPGMGALTGSPLAAAADTAGAAGACWTGAGAGC